MASITFNNLKNTNVNVQNYTYTDLYLDIAEEPIGISGNFQTTAGQGRDIKASYDLNAIRNSLGNLFNTNPGERFLLPEYGSDIRRYLFEPISTVMGQQIAREIISSITRWEPRVTVVNVDVLGIRDSNEYQINIIIRVPFLRSVLNVKGLISRQGVVFT